jgi:hypothetical protein
MPTLNSLTTDSSVLNVESKAQREGLLRLHKTSASSIFDKLSIELVAVGSFVAGQPELAKEVAP